LSWWGAPHPSEEAHRRAGPRPAERRPALRRAPRTTRGFATAAPAGLRSSACARSRADPTRFGGDRWAADTATARSEASRVPGGGTLEVPLRPRDRRVPEQTADGRATSPRVIATIVLYYTYYTQTGVTPNILVSYHMSFAFYDVDRRDLNAIGAFASLRRRRPTNSGAPTSSSTDSSSFGLLVAVGVPLCKTEWQFATVICVLGLVEGPSWLATPALVRDFSPQLGRASAMGFWTVGPVAGSPDHLDRGGPHPRRLHPESRADAWKSQFIISGVTALIVFVLSLFFLKDLSSRLRDQLMVSERDQALVEARARGLSDRRSWPPPPTPGARS